MSADEQTNFYMMGQGCSVHGDEYMRDCSMCGAEFCTKCYPGSAVCEECAVQDDEEDEDEDSDFADVSNLGSLLNKDEFDDDDVEEQG